MVYLCLYTGEAGRCLDLAYAAGGKSDAVKTVDLSFSLDAAHGCEFSHQTLLDRQRTMKEKVPHPEGALPRAERLCLNPTNVHVMWLQQELYLAKYWCVLGKQRPIGLVQRCLFSYGAQHHRYDASLSGFFHTVGAPIVRQLFTYVVTTLGPRSTNVNDRVLVLSAEQTALASKVQQTLALRGQKKTVPATVREAMPKALCWLGTGIITNQVLQNAFHAEWHGWRAFDPRVTDDAFCAALHSIVKRCVNGISVVSTCIGEQLWLGIDVAARPQQMPPHSRLGAILRKSPGSHLTAESICDVDLELRRPMARGTPEA